MTSETSYLNTIGPLGDWFIALESHGPICEVDGPGRLVGFEIQCNPRLGATHGVAFGVVLDGREYTQAIPAVEVMYHDKYPYPTGGYPFTVFELVREAEPSAEDEFKIAYHPPVPVPFRTSLDLYVRNTTTLSQSGKYRLSYTKEV